LKRARPFQSKYLPGSFTEQYIQTQIPAFQPARNAAGTPCAGSRQGIRSFTKRDEWELCYNFLRVGSILPRFTFLTKCDMLMQTDGLFRTAGKGEKKCLTYS
jgi:hypothetical protein